MTVLQPLQLPSSRGPDPVAAAVAVCGGKPNVESSFTLIAGKKAKTAKGSAEKSCGTFMYRKDGKCVDARTKK